MIFNSTRYFVILMSLLTFSNFCHVSIAVNWRYFTAPESWVRLLNLLQMRAKFLNTSLVGRYWIIFNQISSGNPEESRIEFCSRWVSLLMGFILWSVNEVLLSARSMRALIHLAFVACPFVKLVIVTSITFATAVSSVLWVTQSHQWLMAEILTVFCLP